MTDGVRRGRGAASSARGSLFLRPRCAAHILVAGAATVILLLASPVRAADRQALHSHIPQAIADLSLQPIARLPGTNRLQLAIGLPLRNREALETLLEQIYDPTSPQYRHYLTPDEFTEKFGPTRQDYEAVINFAKSRGLTVVGTHPNRMLLDVSGSVANIEKTFHVALHVYRHPTQARTFFAPDVEPSVELTVPLLGISGLNNYTLPHPMNLRRLPTAARARAEPARGSGPSGTYMGSDFRAAYVPGVSLTGAGQTLGLLEFDGYYPSDITAYEGLASLPNVTLQNVLLDGYGGAAGVNNAEVALDIEVAVAMAPGLSKVIVYEAGPSGFPNDILNRMATDNLARQISSSWTWGGGADATTDQIFQQMAAQGQSFFQASGDSGAYHGSTAGDYPADDPYITIVGGTTLATTGPGGIWIFEAAWSWFPFGQADATSGGSSTVYGIPSWQQGISMTTNNGSTTRRNIPDVALTADNICVISDNGNSGDFGGTSCAAPLWAAFAALVNQQATANGLPPIGFINPAIYAIGKGSNFTADFHDVTSGNNTNTTSPGNFFAVTGYDLCTGWGTPNGQNMIDALTGSGADLVVTKTASPNPIAVGSPVTYTVAVTNKGPSAAASVTVTDALPASVTLNSAIASQGACTTNGNVVICAVGSLAGNAVATIAISVTPQSVGLLTNTAVVSALTTDPNPTNNTATAVTTITSPLTWSVTPGAINYGTLVTGQTNNQSFSIVNSGHSTVTGTATLVTAGSPFAIVSGSPFSVSAGRTKTVTVSFRPVSAGSFTNTVVFTGTGGALSNSVTGAAATAAQLNVTPLTQSFGTVTTGTTAQASFVVTNGGGATLSGTASITTAGFSIASNATYTVAGFSSMNVMVNFRPSSAISFTGKVIFTSTGGRSTNTVTGQGVTAPAANFTATPTSGAAPLTVTFADTSTGTITNRVWTWGDGTVTTTIATNLTHVYSCGGPYSVNLVVVGPGQSSTLTKAGLISVVDTTPPTITACAPAMTNSVGADCQASVPDFTSSVQATDNCTPGSALVKTQSPPVGTLVGTGTTAVTITVEDAAGNTATCQASYIVSDMTPPTIVSCASSATATANSAGQAPVPDFTAQVQATDNCTPSNALVKTQSPPAGTLVGIGATPVVISITDASGNSAVCATMFTVQAVPPGANFTATPTTGNVPLAVDFSNLSTGSITTVVWDFGDGDSSTAPNPSHSYTNAGTFSVSLTAYGPAGTNTVTRPGYITVSAALAPTITAGPTVTNAMLQVGNQAVVVAGETNAFIVSATDPNGLDLGYQWQFGDGATNAPDPRPAAVHVYNANCGPYIASVSVNNGFAAVSSNLVVAVACHLPVTKMQLKPNFTKPDSDSAALTATVDLDPAFQPLNQTLTLDMGDALLQFTLSKKGRGITGSNIARLSFNKRTGLWTLAVRLNKGNWHDQWAAHGMVNAMIKTPGVTVTVPVVALVGDTAFATDRPLNYTATADKAGLAK